ncbi:MAG: MaoC family dehydratase [Acidimicrobiales bacterium]
MEPRHRWFDDYTAGETFDVAGERLMTEERIVAFAAEFDPQRFHVDPEAAASSIYGGLIASGWHTGSVLMSLLATTLGPSSLGSPGCDRLRWTAPVRPGDRLSLRITVLEATPSTSRPDRGVLRYLNELSNQSGDVVMTLESTMFLLRRPADDRPAR